MADKKKSSSSSWGINKVSLYTMCSVAVLYLVSMVLSLCGANLKIVTVLKDFATAIMICIVAVLAWRYVAKKQTVWKVLYFLCLLVVIIGIIVPLVV